MNTKMLVVNSGNKDSAVSDKTVRQALGYMVNRDKISKDILDGQENRQLSYLRKCDRH